MNRSFTTVPQPTYTSSEKTSSSFKEVTVCWVALICLLVAAFNPISAAENSVELARWDALAPVVGPYEDPFIKMTYKQKDDLRTILDASRRKGDDALSQRAKEARTRLRNEGYDGDALLAQRLVVMQKRWEEATGVTGRFLGREVLVDGYVLPLHTVEGRVRSFLLVPWVGACIHTPAPPPNQMIRVDVPEGIKVEEVFQAIRLRGVLEHKQSVSNLFLIDGQRVVEASYKLNNAAVWGEPGETQVSASSPVKGNFFTQIQAWTSNIFITSMTAIDQGASSGKITFALAVAFLYGLLHTLGPGHGKAVVISYFVGEGGSLRRGVVMGVRIAIVHVFSAVATVFFLDLAIRQTTGGPPSDYRLIRLASYALIIAIGLWMIWKSIMPFRARSVSATVQGRKVNHVHDHEVHTGCVACSAAQKSSVRSEGWIATAVGIVPCTGALIVMLFGLANDLLVPAIAMVAAISVGMAIAMSMIGIAAIWSRAMVAERVGGNSPTNRWFEAIMRLGGATCVLAVGLLLFTTTWIATSQPLTP